MHGFENKSNRSRRFCREDGFKTYPADEHIIISGDSDFIQLLDTNVFDL